MAGVQAAASGGSGGRTANLPGVQRSSLPWPDRDRQCTLLFGPDRIDIVAAVP